MRKQKRQLTEAEMNRQAKFHGTQSVLEADLLRLETLRQVASELATSRWCPNYWYFIDAQRNIKGNPVGFLSRQPISMAKGIALESASGQETISYPMSFVVTYSPHRDPVGLMRVPEIMRRDPQGLLRGTQYDDQAVASYFGLTLAEVNKLFHTRLPTDMSPITDSERINFMHQLDRLLNKKAAALSKIQQTILDLQVA